MEDDLLLLEDFDLSLDIQHDFIQPHHDNDTLDPLLVSLDGMDFPTYRKIHEFPPWVIALLKTYVGYYNKQNQKITNHNYQSLVWAISLDLNRGASKFSLELAILDELKDILSFKTADFIEICFNDKEVINSKDLFGDTLGLIQNLGNWNSINYIQDPENLRLVISTNHFHLASPIKGTLLFFGFFWYMELHSMGKPSTLTIRDMNYFFKNPELTQKDQSSKRVIQRMLIQLRKYLKSSDEIMGSMIKLVFKDYKRIPTSCYACWSIVIRFMNLLNTLFQQNSNSVQQFWMAWVESALQQRMFRFRYGALDVIQSFGQLVEVDPNNNDTMMNLSINKDYLQKWMDSKSLKSRFYIQDKQIRRIYPTFIVIPVINNPGIQLDQGLGFRVTQHFDSVNPFKTPTTPKKTKVSKTSKESKRTKL